MKNEIRDAVSIIIEHETEVFAIIRQNFLRAFPGYFAFPGGKVDKCDETDATFDIPMLDKLETKLARAMVREIQEELGIKIDDMILSGNVISIDKVGRALTPSFNPFRFNTHFFRVRLKSKVDFSSESFNVDTNEAFDHFWKTPKQILDIFDEGEYLMVPPIRLFLEQLKSNIDFKEEIVLVDRFNNETEVPWIEPMKDFIQVMPKSYTLPPAERTNAFIIGEESKTLIDPSPCELDELKKFENVFLEIHGHIF